jgi:hypothetical protein
MNTFAEMTGERRGDVGKLGKLETPFPYGSCGGFLVDEW